MEFAKRHKMSFVHRDQNLSNHFMRNVQENASSTINCIHDLMFLFVFWRCLPMPEAIPGESLKQTIENMRLSQQADASKIDDLDRRLVQTQIIAPELLDEPWWIMVCEEQLHEHMKRSNIKVNENIHIFPTPRTLNTLTHEIICRVDAMKLAYVRPWFWDVTAAKML